MNVLEQVREVVDAGGRQVFGTPFEKNGLTVIPVARVRGGGFRPADGGATTGESPHGGGVGLDARPAGAFVVKNDHVSWRPAIDWNRIILGAQVVAIVSVLCWRSVVRAQARKV